LDGANQVLRFGPEIETNGIKLRAIHQCVTSAAAYLLSKEGAAKLEARASQYCDHLDNFIFTPRDNWTLLQLPPPLRFKACLFKTIHAISLKRLRKVNVLRIYGSMFLRTAARSNTAC
jgi:hypothetical protein